MHLLDTNVISELRKNKPHGGVIAWYAEQSGSTVFLSSITIYELQAGAERTRIQHAAKAAELDDWISAVQTGFPVLPFGALEARITAFWMRGLSMDLLLDAMIASVAMTQNLTLATRNIRDFERFGVKLVNPFEFGRA